MNISLLYPKLLSNRKKGTKFAAIKKKYKNAIKMKHKLRSAQSTEGRRMA